jgi:hypothetical protein
MTLQRCLALVVFAVLTLVPINTSQAQLGALSFATAGVATSVALDNAEKKADGLIQKAGAVASLTSAKVARDLEILISDARQQMHEELTANWDTLDKQKVDLLRTIDGYFAQLDGLMAKGGLLEEDAYLDLNQLSSKLPFVTTDPVLRSVRGSTLTYRENGLYRIVMRGSIFGPENGPVKIAFDKSPVGPDVKVVYTPAYEAAIDVPAAYLLRYFDDNKLSYIPVQISVLVPDKSYYFYNLRNKKRTASYNFTLQLLPKHPISKYSLIEMNEEPTVDRNIVGRVWGPISQIPGCGHDGCNSGELVCANAPAGAEPIGVVSTYDSLNSAYGEFVGSATVTATTVCQGFHQHRPASRDVKIEISYYPPDTKLIANDVFLHEVSPEDSAKNPISPATGLGFENLYVAYFSNKMKSFRLAMMLFTGEPLSSTPEKTSSPLLDVKRADESKVKEVTVQIKPPW